MSITGEKIRAMRQWTHNLNVDKYAKLVLHTLIFYTDKDGKCFPSVERIAWESSISERKARAVIKALEEGGHIEVIRSTGRRPNTYQLPSNPAQCAGFREPNPARNTGLTASQPGTTGTSTRHDASFNPAHCAPYLDRTSNELEGPPKGKTPEAEVSTTPPRKAAVIDIRGAVL